MSLCYSSSVVATFAKHMICPVSLQTKYLEASLEERGVLDFEKYRYRHHSDFYMGRYCYSEEKLLSYIVSALSSSISDEVKPLLLLSDGKDSMALAAAYSECGVSCDTLTLLRRDDAELKNYVEAVALELGHSPFFISVDEIIDSFDSSSFLQACKCMDTPVLDQGFLFFFFGIRLFFDKTRKAPEDYVIVDGLGNDEYFGYLPSDNQLSSYRLSRLGLWRIIPDKAHSIRWYVRSPAESHGDLSALASFFPISCALDINKYFSKIPHSVEPLSFVDFRAFSRGSFHDHQCMMGKTITSAKAIGSSYFFPWLDSDLSEYCFNIPVSEKFDFESKKNKIPLRALLEKRIGWEQKKRGVDLYFDIDISHIRNHVLGSIVNPVLINKIDSNIFLNESIKKRAYLELLNFCGYCLAHGLSEEDIHSILLD